VIPLCPSKINTSFQIIDEAQRILTLEKNGIDLLISSLNKTFQDSVKEILNLKGRVILTGMGKSGLVARKIAATLASTGTPAFFIHPAEASHGDLGMVGPFDLLFALSNSGETEELSDIVSFFQQQKRPIIGMTSQEESTLAKASTFPFILPKIEEACPLTLAPTTSTTLMMAWGDALAGVLLKLRGFSHKDFHHFHPGGKLGKKLKKVSDIMVQGDLIPSVSLGTSMKDGILEMSRKGFGCVGVGDQNHILQGVVTDGDLRRHLSDGLLKEKVESIMTKNPKTLLPHTRVEEAIDFMNHHGISTVFITDENHKISGIINLHMCIKG
jgi:arabinose-5-phosphate isomerase